MVRYWDLAATEKTALNDPDWTVGIKLGRDGNGGYWLLDVLRERANPGDVERLLFNTATQDGTRVRIGFGKDPGRPARARMRGSAPAQIPDAKISVCHGVGHVRRL